jgi:hypothetical protein
MKSGDNNAGTNRTMGFAVALVTYVALFSTIVHSLPRFRKIYDEILVVGMDRAAPEP